MKLELIFTLALTACLLNPRNYSPTAKKPAPLVTSNPVLFLKSLLCPLPPCTGHLSSATLWAKALGAIFKIYGKQVT